MQNEHHLHRDHIKHVVDHHLHDHLHHNHFNFKTKHHLPFHTVLHRFHYKHHDTHHKAHLHNKLFYAPQMYNAYAFVKDHHHHHTHDHNKHHHHYPSVHHHDSSHGHLKLQPGQAVAAAGTAATDGSQQDFSVMAAGNGNPQMQLPMMQQPGIDQSGMAPSGVPGENVMMQPMGMDPNTMLQPAGMDPTTMMQQGGMAANAMMPNSGMMGMSPQQPGMIQQGGMMSQNGMMLQNGMMPQGAMMPQGGMMTQGGMMPQSGIMQQPDPSAMQMQPMVQGMQTAMNPMQGNGYVTPNGFQQTGAMNNYALQNPSMPNAAQPAMMLGAAPSTMTGQNSPLVMGEQPVGAVQTTNAETNGAAAAAANDAVPSVVGSDKRF